MTDTYDAVLVGASAGSLLAAIRLARAGLRPLVVEKSSYVGGGTAYSGGIVWAPGNHRMRAKGIADSAADGLTYLVAVDPEQVDVKAAAVYLDLLPDLLTYVEEQTTLRWVTYTGLPDYWSELPGGVAAGRFLLPLPWRPPDAELVSSVRPSLHAPGRERDWIWGRALIGALLDAALRLGVDVRLDTPAVALIDGERVSVRIDTDEGPLDLSPRCGVLLNTGGFEWNAEWTARYVPGPPLPAQTPPGNTGDGHAMAITIGAPLALMDHTIAIPGVLVPGVENEGHPLYRIFFQPLAKPHSLVVNRTGRRFANETFFVDLAREMAVLDQNGESMNSPAYFVFDSQYVESYGMPAGAGSDIPVVEAASLALLAERLAVPANRLMAEVAGFNAAVANDTDDRFHRGASRYARAFGDASTSGNPTLGSVERAPYFAVELVLTTSGHRGGVQVDPHGRVLGAEGQPIGGLYACGNVAAGSVTGRRYFSGTSLGYALVLAALAADDMIAEAEDS